MVSQHVDRIPPSDALVKDPFPQLRHHPKTSKLQATAAIVNLCSAGLQCEETDGHGQHGKRRDSVHVRLHDVEETYAAADYGAFLCLTRERQEESEALPNDKGPNRLRSISKQRSTTTRNGKKHTQRTRCAT
jgi:hypothetical protein